MEPTTVVCQCEDSSFWLYTLIWGLILPLFLSYMAAAAYAFQRRRADANAIQESIREMSALTMLALDRITHGEVDLHRVRDVAMSLISRVRLESLHRPKYVQEELHRILEAFLKNAEVADGQQIDNPKEILQRQNEAETSLLTLLRQLTIIEALRQAWSNPGIKVSFDVLMEKFSSVRSASDQTGSSENSNGPPGPGS